MPYRSVRSRLSQADTWLLELFLGAYALVWGGGIANPLTDAFVNSPRAYAVLAGFPGGELVFGAAVLAFAALMLAGVISGSRRSRAIIASVVGVGWVIVAVAIGVPTGWSGGGVLLLLALAHWFCWARLRFPGPA